MSVPQPPIEDALAELGAYAKEIQRLRQALIDIYWMCQGVDPGKEIMDVERRAAQEIGAQ